MALLAVDVGAGTQDILLFEEDLLIENSARMVMPSMTVIVGKLIDEARLRRRDVFLSGTTMGGGESVRAVKRHLEAGLKVFASPKAALTIHDDLERVKTMGVQIAELAPPEAEVVEMGDLYIPAIKGALESFGLEMPKDMAVAVQDHGFSPDRSNRIVRFEEMAKVLDSGGDLRSFVHLDPPPLFNRMAAVKETLDRSGLRSIIMDTGPAAIFGAILDPHYAEPALVLNAGNGHTIGSVVTEGKITALFEHHTSALTTDKLHHFSERLCNGTITSSEIFEDGGHGAHVVEAPGAGEIRSVMVTGPNREHFLGSSLLERLGPVISAAPGGDMMIAGCLGLVEGWRSLRG
ncbi:MAG: DUF1786 domain-containing protein [Methanothrix sp.]|jgi:uncharacterized protein (DUF1786 family)|uniref:Pyruvate formate-lyase activating enzyme n=1 Tax=Methanothrix harundinacea TaxID=301375 RepID=A0A117MCT3_9EURY|nr:MAG: pyruvate formate lyase-activating protein [Methanosaeta sp. SDB]KUK45295.1 MAG: Uncharacterized protein XD72_0323 [Methanothrix harundinacea]MDD2637403.1 DUF1786 domain-containing protein [Methanothrix sp.]MDI9399582.1 DUF1786 domain-containing protein [Euryarchaeota archaeon]KUK96922.1 MAG: Uncharacterized protein XE07_0694 [Methanothrix harundinacea]